MAHLMLERSRFLVAGSKKNCFEGGKCNLGPDIQT